MAPHKPIHPVDLVSTPSSPWAVDGTEEDRESCGTHGHLRSLEQTGVATPELLSCHPLSTAGHRRWTLNTILPPRETWALPWANHSTAQQLVHTHTCALAARKKLLTSSVLTTEERTGSHTHGGSSWPFLASQPATALRQPQNSLFWPLCGG